MKYKYLDSSAKGKDYSYLNYATATIQQALISVCGSIKAHLPTVSRHSHDFTDKNANSFEDIYPTIHTCGVTLNSHSKIFYVHPVEVTRLTNKLTFEAAY